MKAFARINRVERFVLRRRTVPGIKYKMPDGTWRILPHNHYGFRDALSHIDSPAARIVLNAVTDSNNNNGATLQLLWAVMHPVDTEPVQQHEDVPVTAQV
jgi:hypothetical protein